MGRKSQRDLRRKEIIEAFAKVLANHGFAGATMTAVADEAGVSPGLLHHHFSNKQEMLEELLKTLIQKFQKRVADHAESGVEGYLNAALKLDHSADLVAARCWVGIFSEALRDPVLFARVKRYLENEISKLEELSKGHLNTDQTSAILAYTLGALVFGAFAPKKTAGFASPMAKNLLKSMEK
jgi:TetR/AcrR family transcriptional repressor of bet genes